MTKPRTPDNPPGLRDLPFKLPEVSRSEKNRARRIYKALEERHPDAHCELNHDKPFQLLIATILSAQTTDAAVNKATGSLFAAFPDAHALADASPKDIEPHIKSIGLYRNKAKNINNTAKALVRNHDGEVPADLDALLELPGVARKTAGVVLGNAFNINLGVVVDTHVKRLAHRLGLADESLSVTMTERRLMALFPRDKWCHLSHLLIFHGRRVSKARGMSVDDAFDDPVSSKYDSEAKRIREEHKQKTAASARTGAKKAAKKKARKTAKKAPKTARKPTPASRTGGKGAHDA